MGLNCNACPVRHRAACSVLTIDERDSLARAGRTRTLKRGDLLFGAGDESVACATLLKGALKVTSVDENGTERILALVHPAGFVGELFAPFAHHDVVALTDSELCVFPKSEMGRAVDAHPKLAQALLRRTQEDLLQSRELLALSGRRSAGSKVAGFLMGLAEAASDSSCHAAREFELPLTRGEIAGMLGLTIETVSRALTKLERDGLIRRKGARGIELVDPARLGFEAA
jgi:CRP/FNR family transcriptional regulator, anaerobic regulatory protein